MTSPSGDIYPTNELERAWDLLMEKVVDEPAFYEQAMEIKPYLVTRLFQIAQEVMSAGPGEAKSGPW